MLRRFGLPILITAVALFGLYRIRLALRSPSEQLQQTVGTMVAEFNRGRVRSVLEHVHTDFHDKAGGADKEMLHQALVALWGEHREAQTGVYQLEFRWMDSFNPEIAADERSATAETPFQIVDHAVEPAKVRWEGTVRTKFVLGDGGWQLLETEGVDSIGFQRGR
ncbi:MAG: hypothetical protein R3F33_09135 [Planctomycetota bacterium]